MRLTVSHALAPGAVECVACGLASSGHFRLRIPTTRRTSGCLRCIRCARQPPTRSCFFRVLAVACSILQVVSFDALFACTTGWVAWVLVTSPNGEATATTNPLMRVPTHTATSVSSDNPSQPHRPSVASTSEAPISEASTGEGDHTSARGTRLDRAASAGGVQLSTVRVDSRPGRSMTTSQQRRPGARVPR